MALYTLLQEYAVKQHAQDQKILKLVESYTLGIISLLEFAPSSTAPIDNSKALWAPKFSSNTYDWVYQQKELQQVIATMDKIREALKIVNSMRPGPVKAKHSNRIFTALNKIRGHISTLIKSQQVTTQDEEVCDFDLFMDKFFPDCDKYMSDDSLTGQEQDNDQLWNDETSNTELDNNSTPIDLPIDPEQTDTSTTKTSKSFLDYLSTNG